MAQIELKRGEVKKASKKLEKIISFGNKLYISKSAQVMLDGIESNI